MRGHLRLGAAGTAVLFVIAGCTAGHKAGSADNGVAGPAAGGAAGSTAAAGAVPGTADSASAPTLPARSLVKTADLTVRVADVNERAERAIRIATRAGGDVLADERDGSGTHATAALTLEVPPGSLETELGKLAALGDQVERKTSTEDVTQKVVDVTSRLASMRTSLARVRTLYANATSIGDVIKLESEVARRESDLESMEAQQRDLARQAARATIHLRLLAKQAVAPAGKHQHAGVADGFVRGWHAFTASARWTLSALGAVLPFLVLLGAVGALALWWRRRSRTAPNSPPAQR